MTAFVVRERIVHTIIHGGAVYADKWTPVCDACVKPKEQAATTIRRRCTECDQRMQVPVAYASEVCSSRCYQRRRRALRKAAARALCQVCGLIFTAKRSDARYCSDACRQKAFRLKIGKAT
jgi:hypothetical protein